MRVRSLLTIFAVVGCAGGPPPLDWQLNARDSLNAFERHYLAGDTRLAEQEFARAKSEIARTGRGDLMARAELVRCAARVASLDFDECPGFEALRAEAGAEEMAYAEYLSGRRERAAAEEPFSRLVAAGARMRAGTVTPAQIAGAVDIASAQGWRRPLLAWLGVQAKRAETAGDTEALSRIKRRMELVAGEGARPR